MLTKIKAGGRSDTSDYRTNSCGSHKVHKSPRNAILWKPLSSFVTKWRETRCTTHFGMSPLQRTVRQHTFKCWCAGPVELSGLCELQCVIFWWSHAVINWSRWHWDLLVVSGGVLLAFGEGNSFSWTLTLWNWSQAGIVTSQRPFTRYLLVAKLTHFPQPVNQLQAI